MEGELEILLFNFCTEHNWIQLLVEAIRPSQVLLLQHLRCRAYGHDVCDSEDQLVRRRVAGQARLGVRDKPYDEVGHLRYAA